MNTKFTNVEKSFFEKSNLNQPNTKIPYIQVDNIPDLGLLTSLRFLEWIIENPEGVISLPTGKTPEYFIKWTQCLVFLKELTVEDFLNTARTLEESIEGSLIK